MRCPYCKEEDDRVIDSRASADGFVIRRRRLCGVCDRRFTTYERIEQTPLRVIKKDGSRVPFDHERLLRGLLRACGKLDISVEELENVVERVEQQCMDAFDKEVSSRVIGELVMEELRAIHKVAYVRFASVYREFKDLRDFKEFLDDLLQDLEKVGREAGED